MKKQFLTSVAMVAGLFAAGGTAWAHHPFSAEFDSSKTVQLSGTVSKVDWANPHAYLFVDVKDDKSGQTSNWKVELGGPNALTRRGWTQTSIKTGDRVTVNGWQARDGSHFANAKDVKLTNGTDLNAASSYYDNDAKDSKKTNSGH